MAEKKFKWRKKWTHGEFAEIPTKLIEPNEWNPNEMTADEFDMLSENVDDVGFLVPLIVVPVEEKKRFRIIDGEHRFEQQRLQDAETIKCIIASPDRLDEVAQMKQTIRMNKIHGSLSPRKFADFVEKLVEKSDIAPEDVGHELGFVNIDEFQEVLDQARENLPTDEMKDEFDKVKGELKSVDDLTLLLNKLFTKFGDTLPANFMILDFGGKEHIWVRMDQRFHRFMKNLARDVLTEGYTFDSVIEQLMTGLNAEAFCEEHGDALTEVSEEKMPVNIDDMLEDDDE